MRRSASEVLRNLEMRVARLESRTSSSDVPQVGDIFVETNHYGGTRNSFYEVVGVSASLKTITIQKLQENYRYDGPGGTDGTESPMLGKYEGRPIRKRVIQTRDGYSYKASNDYSLVKKWDGKSKRFLHD